MDQKQHLRSHLKAQRLGLASVFMAEQAEAFCARLQTYFQNLPKHQNIGIYLAGKGELDLRPSIEWLLSQGHQLYAPVIEGDDLVFCEYTTNTTRLKVNQFGLFEPDSQSTLDARHLDYVLVPLLGFDQSGHRLGMGKGFYDRTFAFHTPGQKPFLIGCAYTFQEVPELPHEAHDVVLDVVLTP